MRPVQKSVVQFSQLMALVSFRSSSQRLHLRILNHLAFVAWISTHGEATLEKVDVCGYTHPGRQETLLSTKVARLPGSSTLTRTRNSKRDSRPL